MRRFAGSPYPQIQVNVAEQVNVAVASCEAVVNNGLPGAVMGSTLQAWQKTAEKTAGFDWSRKSRLAAELVAEDELTDAEIAERVGIGPRTLYRWKRDPVFVAEVEKRVEEFGRVVRSRGIARLERRIKALNDRWERMNRIIEERAEDPAMANVPGGKTGLLVRRVKGVGRGDGFLLIESYEVDSRAAPGTPRAREAGGAGTRPMGREARC